MRCIVALCVAMLCAFCAEAQVLWTELSATQQRTTLTSRRTPDVVREVMLGSQPLKSLDVTTREQLLAKITSRCSDENLAALYLYIYNVLREPNGSMAVDDVRMLAMHTPLVLRLWAHDEGCGQLYSWAYSLGSHSAKHGHSAVKRALKRFSSKDILSHHAALVSRFSAAYNIARASVSAGDAISNDITPLAPLGDTFTLESEASYDAVSTLSKPIVAPLGDAHSDVERAMRSECMAWDGAYNEAVKHNYGRGLTIIRSLRADGEYLTFVDVEGDSYTFENELFMLDSGYFVATTRHATPNAITLGRLLPRGGFVLFGQRSLDYGTTIRDVKCEGVSVYLYVDVEGIGERYLNYTLR